MPLDQPGSLLSLRLVRIPRLRDDNDARHFLSSRKDSPSKRPLQHWTTPLSGGLVHDPRSNGFGIALGRRRLNPFALG